MSQYIVIYEASEFFSKVEARVRAYDARSPHDALQQWATQFDLWNQDGTIQFSYRALEVVEVPSPGMFSRPYSVEFVKPEVPKGEWRIVE